MDWTEGNGHVLLIAKHDYDDEEDGDDKT